MSVAIVFDVDWEGADDAFQTVVESMAGLLVEVTPTDGGPVFTAQVEGGREDPDSDADEIQIRHVDDIDLEPVGELEYIRVAQLRLQS